MNKLLTISCLMSIILCVNAFTFSAQQISQVKNGRNFKGRVVLVTGSSSGIGEAIVKLFSLLGAKVVVTGRNADVLKRVAQEVHELSPKKYKPVEVVADVTKSDDLKRLMDETIKTYGKLDVLVNNAGVFKLSGIRDKKNFMKTYDQTFQVNVRPVLELSQLAFPYLEKTNGTIISTSSVLAENPSRLMAAYCMSKAAIEMATNVLAHELGPKIRVNSVNPGMTNTHLFDDMDPTLFKTFISQTVSNTPLHRLGEPLDVAKAVAFLASADAQFITGAHIAVNGGVQWLGL